jgi:hypothetical protein
MVRDVGISLIIAVAVALLSIGTRSTAGEPRAGVRIGVAESLCRDADPQVATMPRLGGAGVVLHILGGQVAIEGFFHRRVAQFFRFAGHGYRVLSHGPIRICSRYASFQPAARRLVAIPRRLLVSFFKSESAIRIRIAHIGRSVAAVGAEIVFPKGDIQLPVQVVEK